MDHALERSVEISGRAWNNVEDLVGRHLASALVYGAHGGNRSVLPPPSKSSLPGTNVATREMSGKFHVKLALYLECVTGLRCNSLGPNLVPDLLS